MDSHQILRIAQILPLADASVGASASLVASLTREDLELRLS
jgi:hypothetical protein